jgi:hypothetical protein
MRNWNGASRPERRPAGWHAHDYVVVVLTAGRLMQGTANGEIVTELASGQSYARNAGVGHNVVNPNLRSKSIAS